ncbi:MAG TPA: ArsA family ATPase [Minicystis sp.]|nr:ArsA family ATPase [Minicystis sp.]
MRDADALRPTFSAGAGAAADLATRRFLFVTGKGGVGKTTVSAALALGMAARGRRVLVAMCHTKERLSSLLGTPPIGPDVVSVAERVWAVNIDPDQALREYGELVLRAKSLVKVVFDNRYVKTFFRATPGLYEWSMLGKAWFHTTEKLDDGSNRFDVVLLDAPATGHGLDMLRVPKVILDVVPPGVLRRDAEAAWAMFRDPARSGVVVVTLPEEMPAQETIELVGGIRDELGLPIAKLIVNGVVPPLFTPAERAELLKDPSLLDPSAPARAAGTTSSALVAGARRAIRESVQAECLARLRRELPLSTVELPFLFAGAGEPAGTRTLAAALSAG